MIKLACLCLLLSVFGATDGSIEIIFGNVPNEALWTPVAVLLESSFMTCHKACLARKQCKSMELSLRHQLCKLHSNDTDITGDSLVKKPGTVYSEKRNWLTTILSQECQDTCNNYQACEDVGGSFTCTYQECIEPQPLDDDSTIFGNMKSADAKRLHVCNNDFTSRVTSICQDDGNWSPATLQCLVDCGTVFPNGQLSSPPATTVGETSSFSCDPGFFQDGISVTCQDSGVWEPGKCYQLATNLNGFVYRVINLGNLRWWHFDGSVIEKHVTTLWQPLDNFVKFQFQAVDTGIYRIVTMATNQFVYDAGSYLSTISSGTTNSDLFLVYIVSQADNTFRVISKANDQYVRVNENSRVSSSLNIKDDFALYNLVLA
ncbi:Sushi [Mactra antiquata]